MKPIYILSYDGSVRRERATPTEIRDVIAERRSDRLATVEIIDGELVTHELTAAELAAVASELEADVRQRLHALLDATVTLCHQAKGFDVSLGSNGVITIWNWSHHDNEDVAREALAWAELRGHEIKRSSPPATGKIYYPDATIVVDGVEVCRIVWDSVEVNTDKAIDDEVAMVRAERAQGERELEAF